MASSVVGAAGAADPQVVALTKGVGDVYRSLWSGTQHDSRQQSRRATRSRALNSAVLRIFFKVLARAACLSFARGASRRVAMELCFRPSRTLAKISSFGLSPFRDGELFNSCSNKSVLYCRFEALILRSWEELLGSLARGANERSFASQILRRRPSVGPMQKEQIPGCRP